MVGRVQRETAAHSAGATQTRGRISAAAEIAAFGVPALVTSDIALATLALPPLWPLFAAGPVTSAWLLSAYSVPLAASLIVSGRLADLFGYRILLLCGFAAFGVAAGLAATSWSVLPLLAARAVQGFAAASLVPASLGVLLGAGGRRSKQPRAIGAWSACAGLGVATAYAAGGIVVAWAGWRGLFWLETLIALILFAAALAAPPDPARPGGHRIPDIAGSVLLSAGLASLVLVMSEGSRWGWASPLTAGTAAVGLGLLGLAVVRSARHPVPVLEPDIWRRPRFRFAAALALLYGSVSYALFALVPLLLQQVHRIPATTVSGILFVQAACVLVAGFLAPRLAEQVRLAPVVLAGGLLLAASCTWLLSAVDRQPQMPTWIAANALFGLGAGVLIWAVSASSVRAAPLDRPATAIGVSMAARQLGAAMGVMAIVLVVEHAGAPTGYAHALIFCVVMATIVSLVGLRLRI